MVNPRDVAGERKKKKKKKKKKATASLAEWLRGSPRERQTRDSIPAFCLGVLFPLSAWAFYSRFLGRFIPAFCLGVLFPISAWAFYSRFLLGRLIPDFCLGVLFPLSAWAFSGSSHTSDLEIGTPLATLSGARHYRVSTGTGWPGVSIL